AAVDVHAPPASTSPLFAAGPAVSLAPVQFEREAVQEEEPEAPVMRMQEPEADEDDGAPAAVQREEASGEEEPVQPKGGDGAPGAPAGLHAVAERGLGGASRPLPSLGAIQHSFGRHDVGGARVQVGGPAAAASRQLHA